MPMRRYMLMHISILLILLISQNEIYAMPHDNIDEVLDDPEVLHSYFLGDISLTSRIIGLLSLEDFVLVEGELLNFDTHLEIPRQTSLELESKGIKEQLLNNYYGPFKDAYDRLFSIEYMQNEMVTTLNEISTIEDKYDIGAEVLKAGYLLDSINDEMLGLMDDISSFETLGYDITDIIASVVLLDDRLDLYSDTIDQLKNETSSEDSLLYIRATKIDSSDSYLLKISGSFFFEGLAVEDAEVKISVNDEIYSDNTDLQGSYEIIYTLPPDIKYNKLTIFSETEHLTQSFESEVVEIIVEIPTYIELNKSYHIEDGNVDIFINGSLNDIYGNGLSERSYKLDFDGYIVDLITDDNGSISYHHQGAFTDGKEYLVLAEYMPSNNEPYLYSNSQIKFVLHLPVSDSEGIINHREYLAEIIIISVIFLLSLSIYFIYKRGTRKEPIENIDYAVEKNENTAANRQTLFKEFVLLERLGNITESIILGYSRMLDFFKNKGVIALNPSTTHLDIDSQLKRISNSKEDINIITNTFEIARYSRKNIKYSRKKIFFDSIRNFVNKEGGDV